MYRLDLGKLWRSRTWRRLANLINQLPQASRYYSAVASDEDHVAALLEAQGDQPQKHKGPSVADWPLEVEMLARIIDALRENTSATIAVMGATPPKTKPVERPSTAFEAAREKRRAEQHKSLVARVLPQAPPAEQVE